MKRITWGVSFLVLGLTAILCSFLWKHFGSPTHQLRVGTITPLNGVTNLSVEGKATRQLQEKTELMENDLIQTEELSQARIHLENAGRLVLAPQSTVQVQRRFQSNEWHYVVKVFSGDARTEAEGSPAMVLEKSQEEISWPERLLISQPRNLEEPKSSQVESSGGRPTAQEISSRLAQRRRDFLKCFGQLIQKKHQSKGVVELSFTILPTGRVSNPIFTSQDLDDGGFRNCLFEVVQRVRFQSFSGDAILAKFPLVFD